jgi:sulfur carrier protein ThiS
MTPHERQENKPVRPQACIRIRVRPYADLARFFPGEGRIRVIEALAGATVGDLLDAHGLDESRRLTLGVNDELASRATQLREGDTLEVLVPMSGGM